MLSTLQKFATAHHPSSKIRFEAGKGTRGRMAAQALQSLLNKQGVKTIVMVSGKDPEKFSQLLITAIPPDTHSQIREGLEKLVEEGLLNKEGSQYEYEGLKVNLEKEFGLDNFLKMDLTQDSFKKNPIN
ncbi:MAG: hypothetical protein K2X66_18330 [Cyanobacteria bacterium]|nr:hypothetical protein [Cyanobacteriota bacterium]